MSDCLQVPLLLRIHVAMAVVKIVLHTILSHATVQTEVWHLSTGPRRNTFQATDSLLGQNCFLCSRTGAVGEVWEAAIQHVSAIRHSTWVCPTKSPVANQLQEFSKWHTSFACKSVSRLVAQCTEAN